MTMADRIYHAMEHELSEVVLNNAQETERYRRSVLICKKAMSSLKNYVSVHAFENEELEIIFFKEVKPRFYSKYIYYINVYNFLMQRPASGEDVMRNYIDHHLEDLRRFFDANKAFYQYYRSGSSQMDRIYYTRGGFDVQMELEDFEEDEQYSTSHDYKLSKIIANERFLNYLKLERAKINHDEQLANGQGTIFPFAHPAWTAGQTDAIELLYALKSSGSVNNGNIDIAELIALFEFIFQFELRDAYHKFADITRRKKTIPLFLHRLADALVRWIIDKMA